MPNNGKDIEKAKAVEDIEDWLKRIVIAKLGSNSWLNFYFFHRVQQHRQEIIQELSSMVKELLLMFYRSTGGYKPHRIILYRDGVSEGQFMHVSYFFDRCFLLHRTVSFFFLFSYFLFSWAHLLSTLQPLKRTERIKYEATRLISRRMKEKIKMKCIFSHFYSKKRK